MKVYSIYIVFLCSLIMVTSIASADIISVNGYGDLGNVVSSDQYTEGFFSSTNTLNITSLSVSPASPQTYSLGRVYNFTSTWTNSSLPIDKVTLRFNNINYTATLINGVYNVSLTPLGVGTYNYSWFANDTIGGSLQTNYSNQYTVNIATPTCSLTTNSPLIYPQSASVSGSCTSTDLGSNLYKDNVSVSNPYNNVLGVGTYVFLINSSASQNYTTTSSTSNLVVSQNTSAAINLYVNGKKGNNIFPLNTVVFVDGVFNSTGVNTINLSVNNLQLNTSTTNHATYYYNLSSTGTYNFLINLIANQNYTSVSDTAQIIVSGNAQPPITNNTPTVSQISRRLHFGYDNSGVILN